MRFAYYRRLNPRQKQIYDRSDQAGIVRVPGASELAPHVAAVLAGLDRDDRGATEAAAQRLVESVLRRLHVQPVTVRVLAVRPSNHREELHGLYEYGGGRKQPLISVWMRTAQKRRVVAHRSFLRTLLHEVVHHLDYQMLHLGDSFHTAGFYKRSESLYRQLTDARLARASESESRALEIPVATGSPVPVTSRPTPARPPRRNPRPADPQPLLPFME